MNDIECGKFYSFDEAIFLEDIKSKDVSKKIVLVNFEAKSSIKIILFFNTIKRRELDDLRIFFVKQGVNLRLDDLLGKLHIVILKILMENNSKQIIIISDVGFTNTSIDFLLANFKLFQNKFKNKSVVFCPKLIY